MNKWKWLKEYLQKNNISQAEVAEALQWQKTRVSELLSGKRDLPVNKVLLAAKFFGLDLEELTKYNSGFSKDIPSNAKEKKLPSTISSIEVIDIREYKQKNLPAKIGSYEPISKNLLMIITKNKTNTLKMILARGDDMKPTISDGDILWADTSIIKPHTDGVYLFETRGEVFIKRICLNKIEGGADIISDNQLYPPMYIRNFDNISVIGKIISVTRAI